MQKKEKEHIVHNLYIELVKLQKEIIASDLRVLVIFEGRDAAGKDGTIKTITRHLSPRETKIVALAKPSEKKEHEWYFQRYATHLAAMGEIVLFNRSYYNRAGVEKVMGFCTDKEYTSFFTEVPLFEKLLVEESFIILKYYLDISRKEQNRRLEDRKENPLKQWKISPIDKEAQTHWKDYSDVRNKMLIRTSYKYAPWFIVNADKKKSAHIAILTHLLGRLEYHVKDKKLLAQDYGLIYPVTPKNIKEKLF